MKDGQPSFEIAFEGLINSYEKDEVHEVLKDHYLFKQPRIKIPNTTYLKQIIELKEKTTPTIHSDLAGEEKYALQNDNEEYYPLLGAPSDHLEPSTPQTGRTYTEGEVIDFMKKIGNSFKYFWHNEDWEKFDGTRWTGQQLIDEYLKQNPKP